RRDLVKLALPLRHVLDELERFLRGVGLVSEDARHLNAERREGGFNFVPSGDDCIESWSQRNAQQRERGGRLFNRCADRFSARYDFLQSRNGLARKALKAVP